MKKILYFLPFILTLATMLRPSANPETSIPRAQAENNLSKARGEAWECLEKLKALHAMNPKSTNPELKQARENYGIAAKKAGTASDFLDSMVQPVSQEDQRAYPSITPILSKDPEIAASILAADALMFNPEHKTAPREEIQAAQTRPIETTTQPEIQRRIIDPQTTPYHPKNDLETRFARHAAKKRLALAREYAAKAIAREERRLISPKPTRAKSPTASFFCC